MGSKSMALMQANSYISMSVLDLFCGVQEAIRADWRLQKKVVSGNRISTSTCLYTCAFVDISHLDQVTKGWSTQASPMDSTHTDPLQGANLIFLCSTTCFHQQVLSLGGFQNISLLTVPEGYTSGGRWLYCFVYFPFCLLHFVLFWGILCCFHKADVAIFVSDCFLILFLCSLHFMYISSSSPF